jgi:hypothetical protein
MHVSFKKSMRASGRKAKGRKRREREYPESSSPPKAHREERSRCAKKAVPHELAGYELSL